MWELVKALLVLTPVPIMIILVRWIKLWEATEHERHLPEHTIRTQDIPKLALEVFEVICKNSPKAGHAVPLGKYFKSRGWNERDRRDIMTLPIEHKLVEAHWLPNAYAPTERGLDEWGRLFVTNQPPGQVNFWGGTVSAVNINSAGAVAQSGRLNSASVCSVYQRIAESLRQDAERADGLAAESARQHADDLDEALSAGDQRRIDLVLARINSLISSASSAFSLTRSLISS